MYYHLKAPKTFEKIKQIDCLCLPNNGGLSRKDVVEIDLSNVTFIKPLGVIGVLLLIESIMDKSPGVTIKLTSPSNNEVFDYLLKIEFIKALKSLGDWKIPEGLKATGRKIKPVIPITRLLIP